MEKTREEERWKEAEEEPALLPHQRSRTKVAPTDELGKEERWEAEEEAVLVPLTSRRSDSAQRKETAAVAEEAKHRQDTKSNRARGAKQSGSGEILLRNLKRRVLRQ